ncbi:MAG: site-specific integrase [Bryobacteraceae bacterium]|jgi:integrase
MSVYRPTYREPKTGELKQSAVWWYSFTFAGQRVQESSKSKLKTIAGEAEKNRRRTLEEAYAGIQREKPDHRIRTVRVALEAYRKHYAPNHRAKSIVWVKERLQHVERVLGALLIPDLNESRMSGYMTLRLKEGAGNRTVNMEIDCLARAAGHPWKLLWPGLKRLEEAKDAGQALSPKQEQRLLDCAARSRSPLLVPFIRIALLTGMRAGEIRSMRWGQVNLDSNTLTVGKSKTRASSGRTIPMSADLAATFAGHAAWLAKKLGPVEPGWYVFPFCNRVRPVDPSRPVTSIKTAWESARKAAVIDIRFHDLRHTAYTKMVESGVPEGVIMALMGHVSKAMVERYSHVRMDAMRKAVESLQLSDQNPPSKDSTKVAALGIAG